MDDIYHDKSSSTIDPAVLDAIDSDTIVLINKSDLVSIRIPEPPAKIRYKNTPLGPQGSDVKRIAFRGRVPLRTDGDTSGNTVQHGDFGLRMLEDVRLTDRCLQECRATLHRHIKNIKGARFWLRIYPTHPMSKKPIGVRMGKGKGSFDHWEAKVPAKKILWEIGGGVTEDAAREIFRIVNARLPGKTEVVVAPREERVEELSERICQYTKVPPLGVWCISTKTGEGVDAFMQSFSALLRQRLA
jgi:large subunit ribosomal protein L16